MTNQPINFEQLHTEQQSRANARAIHLFANLEAHFAGLLARRELPPTDPKALSEVSMRIFAGPFIDSKLAREPRTPEPFNHPLFSFAAAGWASGAAGGHHWAGYVDNADGSSTLSWLMTRDAALLRQALERSMRGKAASPLATANLDESEFWVFANRITPKSASFTPTETEWLAITPITGDGDLLEAIGEKSFVDALEAAKVFWQPHPDTQALLDSRRQAAPALDTGPTM